MNKAACPYCDWQTQCKGWTDANSPILREVPMCFGVKHPEVCTYIQRGNIDACPILNKETKKHEQRT